MVTITGKGDNPKYILLSFKNCLQERCRRLEAVDYFLLFSLRCHVKPKKHETWWQPPKTKTQYEKTPIASTCHSLFVKLTQFLFFFGSAKKLFSNKKNLPPPNKKNTANTQQKMPLTIHNTQFTQIFRLQTIKIQGLDILNSLRFFVCSQP